MRRSVISLMGLSLLATLSTACAGGAASLGRAPGVGGSGSPSGNPTPSTSSPAPSGSPSASPSGSPGPPFTYQVWFLRGGQLFESRRTEPLVPGIARLALTRAIAGPSSAEQAASVESAIPPATRVLGLTIRGGLATVDLSNDFESNPVPASMNFRIAQVTYTLTQFSTVQGVAFQIDGKPRTQVGGFPTARPQSRTAFGSLLPAILVESPSIGARVSGPVTVSGTANVFEATVTIRVLDANGHEIARTFTQATCGTGCRGSFSASLSFSVNVEQPGTVEVFDASAKDGSPENVQDIPVTLVP